MIALYTITSHEFDPQYSTHSSILINDSMNVMGDSSLLWSMILNNVCKANGHRFKNMYFQSPSCDMTVLPQTSLLIIVQNSSQYYQ